MDDQSAAIAFLADPRTHGGQPVRRIDTHGAHVFLAGDRAYKLKRAVRLPYMDFSTLALRWDACEAELRLNRRTAPDLYLRVAAITQEPGGLALDGAGPACEAAVVMQRFDDALLFDRLARRGTLDAALMQRLAADIARFHAAADVHRRADPAAHMQQLVAMAVAELRRYVPAVFASRDVEALASRLAALLARNATLIAARSRAGRVRRLHGDLHLGNICLWNGTPTLFDAIEFNDDIAIGDTLYDLAFLLMDLEHRGLRPLANTVLNTYLRDPQDDAGLQLLPMFLALRAAIRAHVGATAAGSCAAEEIAPRQDEARAYLSLAQRLADPPAPRLVAVGGYSGTGKSTVARALAPGLGAAPGAVLLRSDEIRKALFRVPATERLPAEAYGATVSRRVYDILYARAEQILRAGHAVIIDGVFLRPDDRTAVEAVAARAGAVFRGLWLAAPFEILAARVAARRNDPSDATVDVLRRQMETPRGPMSWYTLDAGLRPDAVLIAAIRAAN